MNMQTIFAYDLLVSWEPNGPAGAASQQQAGNFHLWAWPPLQFKGEAVSPQAGKDFPLLSSHFNP